MIATGDVRLDGLLGGGLPDASNVLVYGPSFVGKNALAYGVLASALDNGLGAVVVLASRGAGDVRAYMEEAGRSVESFEKEGHLVFIDAYSRCVGVDEEKGNSVVCVDSIMDLAAISVALNDAQAKLLPEHPQQLIIVDSLSTLIAYHDAQTIFRFGQVLVGRARRSGATTLLMLDEGMHDAKEVELFRHMVGGVVHLRDNQGTHQCMVQGLGLSKPTGWIEYEHDLARFNLTGSFAAGRIR